MQERYWNLLAQYRFELFYYQLVFARSVKVERWSQIVIACLSAGAVIGWRNVGNLEMLWASIIFASQLFGVARDYFPFKKRIRDIPDLVSGLTEVYFQVESGWLEVACGELSEPQINEKLYRYYNEWDRIARKHLNDDALPETKKYIDCAADKTEQYFNTLFKEG